MDQKNIRNFAIIAHIDHGKSTLADRLLEITGTISKNQMQDQFLDQNPISRKRGITIKLAPVRMNFKLNATNYTLNLIDTPGHVDFSYEVSRTLAACEGAVLLVDATQGIQAQTVAHFNAAKKENLVIIPVINKIDLENAEPEIVAKTLCEVFGFKKEDIIYISAKTGQNVESLLRKIIEKIPAPSGLFNSSLRALIFDAVFDEHKGVIAYIRIMDGKVRPFDKIEFFQMRVQSSITELGFFSPDLIPLKELCIGEIGYLITGIKDMHQCRVGDTITIHGQKIEPLPGYKTPKPMVFFGVYPKNTSELVHLKLALDKLCLNDTSLTVSQEYSAFLGSGFRVGFLGLLHAEIVKERLQQEEQVEPLLTMPQVLYQKGADGIMLEPYMNLTVYTPKDYVGGVMSVCQKKKGNLTDISYHESYVSLYYQMPYSMFIRGLSSELKSVSSGFASIDYELSDYQKADLVNLEIRINDSPIDVLSEFVYKEDANFWARDRVEKLKKYLPRQQYRQIIQAITSGRILAREEISPFRKDVIAKLSGGDRTRKDKLLKKQKKGKDKLLSLSRASISQEALTSFLIKETKTE